MHSVPRECKSKCISGFQIVAAYLNVSECYYCSQTRTPCSLWTTCLENLEQFRHNLKSRHNLSEGYDAIIKYLHNPKTLVNYHNTRGSAWAPAKAGHPHRISTIMISSKLPHNYIEPLKGSKFNS
jgi:hypothetical protein